MIGLGAKGRFAPLDVPNLIFGFFGFVEGYALGGKDAPLVRLVIGETLCATRAEVERVG